MPVKRGSMTNYQKYGNYVGKGARKQAIEVVEDCCEVLSRVVEVRHRKDGCVEILSQCVECSEITTKIQEATCSGAKSQSQQ